jgi:tRNA(fMet)-specific endonuclease VapC
VGWNAYLHRAKKMDGLIRGDEKFQRLLLNFTRLNILAFDREAADEYEQLNGIGVRIGAMDLRIAAVAIANDCVLVTRNTVDFERVPGLRFEDWTLPKRS